jgi:hypothetical protein
MLGDSQHGGNSYYDSHGGDSYYDSHGGDGGDGGAAQSPHGRPRPSRGAVRAICEAGEGEGERDSPFDSKFFEEKVNAEANYVYDHDTAAWLLDMVRPDVDGPASPSLGSGASHRTYRPNPYTLRLKQYTLTLTIYPKS